MISLERIQRLLSERFRCDFQAFPAHPGCKFVNFHATMRWKLAENSGGLERNTPLSLVFRKSWKLSFPEGIAAISRRLANNNFQLNKAPSLIAASDSIEFRRCVKPVRIDNGINDYHRNNTTDRYRNQEYIFTIPLRFSVPITILIDLSVLKSSFFQNILLEITRYLPLSIFFTVLLSFTRHFTDHARLKDTERFYFRSPGILK